MRVGYEGSAYMEPATGVGQYVRALWREYERDLPGLEPVMLLPGPRATLPETPPGEVIVEEPPRRFAAGKARKLWWEQVGLPRAARRAGVDLVHVPYHAAPLRREQPYVVTVHDLVPLAYPVYMNSRQMRLYYRLACYTASRADLILTDSRHSADDIRRHLGIAPARIRPIPLAADERYRPLPPDEQRIVAARARFGLDGPFIFNIAGLDVRKNQAALIRAFALVRERLPAGTRLVIGGKAHSGHPDRYPDLAPIVAEAGVAPWTVFTGRIGDDEKLALLCAAALYVDPSLYEGFGLSALEAMQCGTPTVAADRSSLPEVVGEGGLLVEPTPEALGAAIVALLNSPESQVVFRRRALAQSARFSWAQTARQTAAAYAEVLANGGRAPRRAARGKVGA